MKNLKRVLPMLLALILVFTVFAGATAFAAPVTVKIICPYGAGGVADLVTREYAKAANNVQSDYNFIVENLTGGDGFVANATFSEEAPDTKDLLVMGYGVCYRVDAAAKYARIARQALYRNGVDAKVLDKFVGAASRIDGYALGVEGAHDVLQTVFIEDRNEG